MCDVLDAQVLIGPRLLIHGCFKVPRVEFVQQLILQYVLLDLEMLALLVGHLSNVLSDENGQSLLPGRGFGVAADLEALGGGVRFLFL